jgi:DNA-binding HxlR family transcriptional regulator
MPRTIKDLPVIPAERTLQVISGRWKALVLYHLFDGPKRLSELTRLVPRASQKMLIQQLREMEAHGVVHREIFKEVPARVEYSATPPGASLRPVIRVLCEWGLQHAVALNQLEVLRECLTSAGGVTDARGAS